MRRYCRMFWGGIVSAVLLLTVAIAIPVAAQSPCSLSPVFALFRQVAGASVIGECKEPPTVGSNGDISQATTRGLAVYRYADQVTAFTDGQTTWLFGPEGLQKRAISDKFAWERAAPAPSVAPLPVVGTAPSVPTSQATDSDYDNVDGDYDNVEVDAGVPGSKLTPSLVIRCNNLGAELGAIAPPGGERIGSLMSEGCLTQAEQHGEIGVGCYEPAARKSVRSLARLSSGDGRLAAQAMRADIDLCIITAEQAGR